jgi:hypothetical protein
MLVELHKVMPHAPTNVDDERRLRVACVCAFDELLLDGVEVRAAPRRASLPVATHVVAEVHPVAEGLLPGEHVHGRVVGVHHGGVGGISGVLEAPLAGVFVELEGSARRAGQPGFGSVSVPPPSSPGGVAFKEK